MEELLSKIMKNIIIFCIDGLLVITNQWFIIVFIKRQIDYELAGIFNF